MNGSKAYRPATPLDLAIRGFMEAPDSMTETYATTYMVGVTCLSHPGGKHNSSGKIQAIKRIRDVAQPTDPTTNRIGLKESKGFVEGTVVLKLSLTHMSTLEKEGWRFSHSETAASANLIEKLDELEVYYHEALAELKVRKQDLIGSMSTKCDPYPIKGSAHTEEAAILGRAPQWASWTVDDE